METQVQQPEPVTDQTQAINPAVNPFKKDASFYFLEDEPEEYVLASKGLRFGGYLIDIVGMLSVGFILGIVLAVLEMDYLIEQINERLLGLFILFTYYLLTEGIFGQTLGKIITRTKVVTENGLEPSFPQILGRTLCRLIPFDAITFLTSETGMHDRLSKTHVVKIPRVHGQ